MTASLGARALVIITVGVATSDGGASGGRESTAGGRRRSSAAGGGGGGSRVGGAAGRATSRATGRARAEQGGAGDGVLSQGGVGVEEDTGVGGGVQLGTQGALRALSAAAGDGNVDAEGVVLSTILGASAVHGDDLVAEDVRAGGQAVGDGDGPGVVVGDQVRGSPRLGVQVDTSLVNLDPLEGGLVDGGAGIVGGATVGNVGQDGSDVGLGPSCPVWKHARLVLDFMKGVLSLAIAA